MHPVGFDLRRSGAATSASSGGDDVSLGALRITDASGFYVKYQPWQAELTVPGGGQVPRQKQSRERLDPRAVSPTVAGNTAAASAAAAAAAAAAARSVTTMSGGGAEAAARAAETAAGITASVSTSSGGGGGGGGAVDDLFVSSVYFPGIAAVLPCWLSLCDRTDPRSRRVLFLIRCVSFVFFSFVLSCVVLFCFVSCSLAPFVPCCSRLVSSPLLSSPLLSSHLLSSYLISPHLLSSPLLSSPQRLWLWPQEAARAQAP